MYISKSVSKLGGTIPSINMPPKITCRLDAPCMRNCYACKGRFAFPSNKKRLAENLQSWKDNPICFEHGVITGCQNFRYTRWHSAGDIPDPEYLQMMIRVAESTPHTEYLAFTKRYEFVNDAILRNPLPENLIIIFSAWGDAYKFDNPHNLPVAHVRLRHEECTIPESAFECNGFCGECANTEHSCWHLKRGESVVFNQH